MTEELPRAGDDHLPGEIPTSEFSELEIAWAREWGLLRVDKDGLGWIHDMKPSGKGRGS